VFFALFPKTFNIISPFPGSDKPLAFYFLSKKATTPPREGNFSAVGDFSTSLEMTNQFTMHNAQFTIKVELPPEQAGRRVRNIQHNKSPDLRKRPTLRPSSFLLRP
jgi:hypothetical protein